MIALTIILYTRRKKDIMWKLKLVVSHEGFHIAYNPNAKVSWYYVMVEWGKWETTTDPPTIIMGGEKPHVIYMRKIVRKRGVTEISKVFLFLVFSFLSLDCWTQIRM